MLFNSAAFVFAFLPLVVAASWLAIQTSQNTKIRNVVLLAASLFFYGYWNIYFLPLLVFSIAFNYSASLVIERRSRKTATMAVAVAANILCLGVFKYLLFFSEILIAPEDVPGVVRAIVLPIGISFFTFQQIAYVVDVWKDRVRVGDPLSYAVFVSFFPQLIAGPIVRYQQIVPQLLRKLPPTAYIAPGIFLFVVGLFKKVVLADSLAKPANDIFSAVGRGASVGFGDSWLAALAYTFQLYFDFSAYSDMALGLGLLFGLRLPINFDSPYKATNIMEFWRRWHITLSSFFRDYVYIPLGGSRHGLGRQICVLLFVMTLVGLWHGAGWTFVVWGAYHGVLLATAHAIDRVRLPSCLPSRWRILASSGERRLHKSLMRALGWTTTFGLVVAGWVIFRAPDLDTALRMLTAMGAPQKLYTSKLLLYDARYVAAMALVAMSFAICLLLPNAVRAANVALETPPMFDRPGKRLPPAPVPAWLNPSRTLSLPLVAILVVLFYFACTTMLTTTSEFIYFQF